MSQDAIDLRKPERRARLARADDSDDTRDMWHAIHDQDNKLKLVDRELAELRRNINDLTVSIAVITKAVEGIDAKLDTRLSEQFMRHEKREMEMQQRVMGRGLLLVLSILGALAYYVLSKVALATGGAA